MLAASYTYFAQVYDKIVVQLKARHNLTVFVPDYDKNAVLASLGPPSPLFQLRTFPFPSLDVNDDVMTLIATSGRVTTAFTSAVLVPLVRKARRALVGALTLLPRHRNFCRCSWRYAAAPPRLAC